jgi:acyl-[acyl carrier protein]--UDP-N-acetylglucosamine O-acyltransferase
MLNFKEWSATNSSKVSGVKIGDYNVMRDRVSIDSGTVQETTIANHCYIHSNCLVNHDCQLSEGVVFAPGVQVAGSCIFGKYSQIGLNAVVHQGRKVGAFAMVGMNATVTRDISEFALSYGSPSRTLGVNRIRLERLGISQNDIDATNDFLIGRNNTCPLSVMALLNDPPED